MALPGVAETDARPLTVAAELRGTTAPRWLPHRGMVAAFTIAVVAAIQLWAGAYRSERGLYSDESAHFMNGLVLRDYVRENPGQSPMTFAREYYSHYPKIAPF